MVKITTELSNRLRNMAIVCAFLVVIIHCRPVFPSNSVSWWVKQMLECGLCTIAVPFFFVASGFFLCGHVGEKGWYEREVLKRASSLLVPYFIWITLYFIFDSAWNVSRGQLSYANILNGMYICDFYGIKLTGCPGHTPLWYVRGLFILVLLCPILNVVLKLKWIGLAALFVVYGVFCPGPDGSGFVHSLTRCGILPLAGIFYFSLGMMLRKDEIAFESMRKFRWVFLAIGFSLAVLQAFGKCNTWCFYEYFGWLAIPFMLLGVWYLIPDCEWSKKVTAYAFQIFILHRFFFQIGVMIVGGCNTLFSYAFVAVFMFVVSLLVSTALKRFAPRLSQIVFGGR